MEHNTFQYSIEKVKLKVMGSECFFNLYIGWGKGDITPNFSTPLTGFVRRCERRVNTVADRLFVRAFFIRCRNRRAIILSYDLLGFGRKTGKMLRSSVQNETGIEEDEIILLCTHTHSAPPAIELTKCGEIVPEYIELVTERTIQALREALGTEHAVRCFYSRFHLKELSVNRRDGTTPINDYLTLLQFKKDSTTLGLIIHYSAHPNAVCEDRISADYPGYICKRVEAELGIPFSLFITGTAGDTNPLLEDFSYEEMEKYGAKLFQSIRTNLDKGNLIDISDITLSAEELPVLLEPHIDKKALKKKVRDLNNFINGKKRSKQDAIYEIVSRILDEEDLDATEPSTVDFVAKALLENNKRYLAALQKNSISRTGKLRVQFVLLDDLALIFAGAELFSHTYLELEKRFPNKEIMLCGYLDPLLGYIPPEEEYERGGYEIDEAFLFFGADMPLAKNTESNLISYIEGQLKTL